MEKEPTLEEYGLNVSSYENYRNKKEEVEMSFSKFKKEVDDNNNEGYYFSIALLLFILGTGGSLFSLMIESGTGNYTFSLIFGSLLLLGYIFNRIDNALVNKRLSIINPQKRKTDDEIELIKSKIYPFEEAYVKYLLNFRDEFYKNNLYRKHSNTEKYKKSSEILSLIKDEIIAISQKIAFKHKELDVILNDHINCLYRHISDYKINLHHFFNTLNDIKFSNKIENELKIYLENQVGAPKIKETGQIQKTDISKKIAEEIFQKEQAPIVNSTSNSAITSNIINDNVKPIQTTKEGAVIENKIEENKGFWANLMKDVKSEIEEANNNTSTKEIVNTIDIVSPEKKYSTPRKIDWENINKNKPITGLRGEEIALEMEKEYLKLINREDLAEKVKQVSIEGDGFGYDILSYFPDGQEKYIEVKSSKNSNSNSFNISSNELDFMKKNQYNYQIWRMFNVNENDNIPTLKVHNANDILTFKKITPVQYVVKME